MFLSIDFTSLFGFPSSEQQDFPRLLDSNCNFPPGGNYFIPNYCLESLEYIELEAWIRGEEPSSRPVEREKWPPG